MVTQKKYDMLKAMLIAQRKKNRLSEDIQNDQNIIKDALEGTGVKFVKKTSRSPHMWTGTAKQQFIVRNKYNVEAVIYRNVEVSVMLKTDVFIIDIIANGSIVYKNWHEGRKAKVGYFGVDLEQLPIVMKEFASVAKAPGNKSKTKAQSSGSVSRVIKELVRQMNEIIKSNGDDTPLTAGQRGQLMSAYKKDLALGDLPLDTWPDELEDTISMFVTQFGMGSEPDTSYHSEETTDQQQTDLENLWSVIGDLLEQHGIEQY